MPTAALDAAPRRSSTAAGPTAGASVALIAPAVLLVIGTVAAVNLAIPTLQAGDLSASVSETAWIVDSYTLVFACLLIPAGALGDRFGRRRGMLAGLALFAAGSAIAALAPSVAVLMAGRALTGIGAALVLPSTLAATLTRLPGPERPRAVALWSALTGVGGAVGNLGGGLAVEVGGWRVLFWAGVPIALVAAVLIARAVPEQPAHRDPVDAGGAALLTAGMVALLFGVIDAPQHGWASPQVLGALALGLVALGGFVRRELRVAHPMLDPRLFALAGVRAGSIGIVALFFVLFGLFYVNAQYLQDVKGFSPLLAGVCVLPIAITMPWTSARSPAVAERFGSRRTIVAGLLVVSAGLAALSLATAGTPYALYAGLLAVVGAGMGLALPPLSGSIVHALPPTHAGVASGLSSTVRELGSAIGVAVLSTVLSTRFAHHLPAALQASDRHDPSVARSTTAALHAVGGAPSIGAQQQQLLDGVHRAFISGTSLGLRVGVALLLLTTVLIALEHPKH